MHACDNEMVSVSLLALLRAQASEKYFLSGLKLPFETYSLFHSLKGLIFSCPLFL